MRPRVAAAAGSAFALLVALGACSENTGSGAGVDTNRTQTGVIATDPKDSLGPAPEVAGATRGGTFTVIRETRISHLDPQRTYSFAGLMAGPLYSRYLTTWRDDGNGKLVLVGDLAETPGKNVNNDCKVWEFKIKDGVKFEDGSPITAKEIAYGIARSFDPDLTGGPTYLQEWLADTAQYDTKWDFKANRTSLPPGLSTPDEKTLRFEFAKPHCDLPFAVSLPTTAPMPPGKDTGVNYDNQPFSSGPYKITKHHLGRRVGAGAQRALGPGHRPGAAPVPGPVRLGLRAGPRRPAQPDDRRQRAGRRARSPGTAYRPRWSPRSPVIRR